MTGAHSSSEEGSGEKHRRMIIKVTGNSHYKLSGLLQKVFFFSPARPINEHLGFKSKLGKELDLIASQLRILVSQVYLWNHLLAL